MKPRHSSPCIDAPRRHLIGAVLAFVHAARACPSVERIALVGSLTTAKPIPKDADVLVTIDEPISSRSTWVLPPKPSWSCRVR